DALFPLAPGVLHRRRAQRIGNRSRSAIRGAGRRDAPLPRRSGRPRTELRQLGPVRGGRLFSVVAKWPKTLTAWATRGKGPALVGESECSAARPRLTTRTPPAHRGAPHGSLPSRRTPR